MQKTDEFRNKTVLITGASRGIGAATAARFGSLGARVIIHYNSSADAAKKVLDGVKSPGGSGELWPGDLSTHEGIQALAERARQTAIDILVNNAGSLIRRTRVLEFTPELWDQTMLLNLTSAFFLAQAVLPGMIERKGGCIVNVSSVAGRMGGGIGAGVYAAAKGALTVVTKNLAREFAPMGIHVNAVSPGTIDTDYHRTFSTEQMLNSTRAATPMGRLGTSEEVADVIVFLCSADSRFIQGQAIEVNGGFLMV